MPTEQVSIWLSKILVALTFFGTMQASGAEIDATDVLRAADLARGGGLAGLTWEVEASNSGGEESEQTMRMLIKAIESASLAETIEPLKSKGTKMLQRDRNMWLSKPGLKKPIPISPRQRLTGMAAIGDIAATNYVRDYVPRFLREEFKDGKRCFVLELSARDRQATYDKLLYWISEVEQQGVYAEFLSLSGKRLKTASFQYKNAVMVNGRQIAFVSAMTIKDELTSAKTVLRYSNVRIQAIAPSQFDLSHID